MFDHTNTFSDESDESLVAHRKLPPRKNYRRAPPKTAPRRPAHTANEDTDTDTDADFEDLSA